MDGMDVFQLTCELININSVTGKEEEVGAYLYNYLVQLAERYDGIPGRVEVAPSRSNVFASFGTPSVTLSTHMDTVRPFIASREEEHIIWGRGACDAKGIIAAMLTAAEYLLAAGTSDIALLFVVGEEDGSEGAKHAEANSHLYPTGSRFLINGEPTCNELAQASKGSLRYIITASGTEAHSGYPEEGISAIDRLLDVLDQLRKIKLPTDKTLGPSTLNIGKICGGTAHNIISGEASAELGIRLVGDSADTRTAFTSAVANRPGIRLAEGLEIPPVRMKVVEGLATTVVAYTTDIPLFGSKWGEPLLIGPGTIKVAHKPDEHISKQELLEAVEIYRNLVVQLQHA